MRRLTTAGLIGVLAGCPRAMPPSSPGGDLSCPDPTNCTLSNGTGVYTAEDGWAGIGPSELMITHFINNGSSVSFQGRYRIEASSQTDHDQWRLLSEPGQVFAAMYLGRSWQVTSVTESSTDPTWVLQDTAGQSRTEVIGEQLHQLTLSIRFTTARDGSKEYLLDFDGPPISLPTENGRSVTSYHMRWSENAPGATAVSYCQDASRAPDPVVFQRGIDVDPVIGAVARNSQADHFVTLSCYRGAPATVYRWKYDYVNTDTFYFDAGIQMKRASYCGLGDYYTIAGTQIQIGDDRINRDLPIHMLEAWWSPQGALCWNPANARHPELVAKKNFTGNCHGRQLSPCQASPTSSSTQRFLVEGPFPP